MLRSMAEVDHQLARLLPAILIPQLNDLPRHLKWLPQLPTELCLNYRFSQNQPLFLEPWLHS